MIIQNTNKVKIGSAGKRNRAARRRTERRMAYHAARTLQDIETSNLVNEVEIPLSLSGTWDESLARKALDLFSKSGQSQRAFAAQYGFSDSKLRSWKKKLETQTI